jgi:hypothetical protein
MTDQEMNEREPELAPGPGMGVPDGAPTEIVPAPGAPASGASRGRWLAAGAVAVVAIGAIGLGAALLGSRPTPEALRYIPGDAASVIEVRMDLPGDQLQKVGNLLAHFPGFGDQSSLPAKLDESLERLVSSATKGSLSYATQLKPWLAGPLFASAAAPASASQTPAFLVVATTDGKVTCGPVFGDATTTTETYHAVQVTLNADGTMACAMDGRFGLIGTQSLIHAAIDAHAAHSGIDGNAAYRAARDALGGDQLASIYVGRQFYAAMLSASGGSLGLPGSVGNLPPAASEPAPGASPASSAAAIPLPDWTMVGLRAEDAALTLDVVSAVPPSSSVAGAAASLATAPPAHVSRIAPLLPADTAAMFELHGTGIAIENALAAARANAQLAPALKQVDATLAVLGGPDGLVGWIDDAGVVVLPNGSSVTGGLVLVAKDDATAAAKAEQIRGFITLAGLGGQIQTHDDVVNGTTITTVDLGDVSVLLQQAGAGGLSVPSGTHLVLQVAAHGSALLIGADQFANRVLATTAGAALTDQAGYKVALGRGDASNLSQLYVSVGSVLSLAETAMPADERTTFDANVKPYLAPFDVILETTTSANGLARARFIATVR